MVTGLDLAYNVVDVTIAIVGGVSKWLKCRSLAGGLSLIYS